MMTNHKAEETTRLNQTNLLLGQNLQKDKDHLVQPPMEWQLHLHLFKSSGKKDVQLSSHGLTCITV